VRVVALAGCGTHAIAAAARPTPKRRRAHLEPGRHRDHRAYCRTAPINPLTKAPRKRDSLKSLILGPANAVVVSIDEKSQIQALDRTRDYVRHGTATLFAALEVATGKISTDACYPRHSNVEFLAFLKQVAKAYPRVKPHVIGDNYATHTHPNVKTWPAKNPRITLHSTKGSPWSRPQTPRRAQTPCCAKEALERGSARRCDRP
jgi:hypothetical protein